MTIIWIPKSFGSNPHARTFPHDILRVNPRAPTSTETYQDRLSRLETDKESLVLQVSVLTDQVEAQGVKISDLESCLEEHQFKLNTTEEMLQQELHRRASREAQKQKQVSHLTLQLTSMEDRQALGADRQALGADRQLTSMEDRQALGADRQHKAEVQHEELKTLKEKVEVLEEQRHLYERRLKTTKAQILDLQQVLLSKNAEIDSLHSQLLSQPFLVTEGWEREEMYRRRLNNKHQELQRLRTGMESLLAANDEKDRRIEELTLLLSQCRQFREISTPRHSNHAPPPASPSALPVSNQRTPSSSSEEEEQGATTTAVSTDSPSSSLKSESHLSSSSSSPQLRSSLSSHKDARSRPQPLLLFSSMNDLQNGSSQKAQQQQREGRCFTLPVKVSLTEHNGDSEAGDTSEARETSDSPEAREARDTVHSPEASEAKDTADSPEASEAKDTADSPEAREARDTVHSPEASDCQSQISPAPCEDGDTVQRKTEKTVSIPPSDSSPQSSGAESGQRLVGSPEHLKNNRSIRKLWGKLRRTQSGGLQSGGLQAVGLQAGDQDQSQFRRGGLRATAGPRLTRSPGSASAVRDANTPFRQWSREQVCGWLEDCGLGQYVNLTRHWVESGQTLLSATPQDFEKEMGMKHALHRKKLQLALSSFSTIVVDKSSELDHIWVTRWLDDIGLPQYKDQFHEGRVDGRMIQYLTVNDLLTLKVTSQLHHLSIKCAIHVLHVNKFNPHCLRRRPGEEKQPPPSEVVQWSNHRVMEWLRAVELAEYAPNLRGSGVHGGLIILEPRFSSETLALLLNIPPQKTLLRRHLASAFSALVGPQASLEKREYANATGHVPLTTTAKVRPKKLGFNHFSHLRKRRPDETADYICPIDTGALASNGVSPRPYAGLRGLSPILDRDTDARQEQVGTKT